MLAKSVQRAGVDVAFLATLAQVSPTAFLADVGGKIFSVARRGLLDFLPGGRRLCVLNRHPNGLDLAALRDGGH